MRRSEEREVGSELMGGQGSHWGVALDRGDDVGFEREGEATAFAATPTAPPWRLTTW